MADTKLTVTLNGDNSSAIRELHDIELLATFENGNPQANITSTEFEFVNEFAESISDWISGGLTGGFGIFQGIPLSVSISGQNPTYNAFDGFLDMTDEFEIVNPTTIKGKIKKDNGLQNLDDLASGLTWEFLFQEGILTVNDMVWCPYIIEEKFDVIAFLLLILAIFQTTVILIDLIKSIAQSIASGITAPILFALDVIYAGLLIVALISMLTDFIRMIIQPIKYTRAMRLKKLLEIGSNHLGYQYNTTISEIQQDKILLLPSKNSVDEEGNAEKQLAGVLIYNAGNGYPSARDYGYTFGEILALVNKTFNAKIGLKNGVIQQHSLNSSWWIQQSTYTMPPILLERKKFNADEMTSNVLLTFTPDAMDKNCIENYKGTSYEVITTPISTPDIKRVLLKGLDEVEIPYALGIRKNKSNFIERTLDGLISIVSDLADAIADILPFVDSPPAVVSRIGVLKMETDFLNIAKMLYTDPDCKLPVNYHDLWSAKVLYNKYHIQKSFVGNNFVDANQYEIYEGVRIPFGFTDFLTLIDNSYFWYDNQPAQVNKIQWNVSNDYAVVDFKVQRVYTKNLQETFVEVGENYD